MRELTHLLDSTEDMYFRLLNERYARVRDIERQPHAMAFKKHADELAREWSALTLNIRVRAQWQSDRRFKASVQERQETLKARASDNSFVGEMRRAMSKPDTDLDNPIAASIRQMIKELGNVAIDVERMSKGRRGQPVTPESYTLKRCIMELGVFWTNVLRQPFKVGFKRVTDKASKSKQYKERWDPKGPTAIFMTTAIRGLGIEVSNSTMRETMIQVRKELNRREDLKPKKVNSP